MADTSFDDFVHDDSPDGWEYNPSAWRQRLPIILLACVGAALAAYLLLFQWRMIDTIWEPYFGRQGRRVLRRLWIGPPMRIPGGLIALIGFLSIAATMAVGRAHRWRSMPWMVLLSGGLTALFGLTCMVGCALQPILHESTSTVCLLTGGVAVLLVGPAMDEVLATLQYLRLVHDDGDSVWRALWGISFDEETDGVPWWT
jgi:hypothetical protein